MREDLLKELETAYEEQRRQNEAVEAARRMEIQLHYPEIESAVQERQELIYGTIHRILEGNAKAEDLSRKMADLNEKIGRLLIKNGKGREYLSPVYKCSVCKDTGYTGDPVKEPCECMRRAYQELLRKKIGLGSDDRERFENYDSKLVPDEIVGNTGRSQRQITEYVCTMCRTWAEKYPDVQQRDILLTGNSGLGKTFMMRAMATRLIERGMNVLIVSAYTFLQMARKSYFDSETGVRELMEVPVLMLDDLGSEPLMQNITVEQLFYLLNERQNRGHSTVISTNLNLQELRERYTERIVSRLNNPKNCLILTLAGKDLRKLQR
ncbi:MAG: ATP-binding protein [Clostridia bacterium]|nr:ATP-binding protein [Clostridia bacterium]